MTRFAGLALTAVALAACDSAVPTAPNAIPNAPALAAVSDVNISGRGTAEWLSSTDIETHASFTCPEGLVAIIDVTVRQNLPIEKNVGKGQVIEHCKVGPNTVSVRVTGGPSWDIAKASAEFTMNVALHPKEPPVAKDTDVREILITAQ